MQAEENQLERCRERALRLLERRAHSVAELRRKLRARKFPGGLVEQVLGALLDVKLLDDEAFARSYCEYRRDGGRPVGRRKVEMELRKRGIDRELIGNVLAEVWDSGGDEDEFDRAMRAGRTKWRSVRDRSDLGKAHAKVFRFLAARGFPPDVCRRVLDHLDEDASPDGQ